MVTGELWHDHRDFQLEGPFGLHFGRTYGSQSTFSGDLGFGWRSEYDVNLDLSQLSTMSTITYNNPDGSSEAFINVAIGSSDYNNYSGDTLSTDGNIYTLTTWHHMTYSFDLSGRLLRITDRAGNTQTVFRSASNPNQMTAIKDTLGRQLQFQYDSKDRITNVTTSLPGSTSGYPSSAHVILVYDSGISCGTGDLCSVTEPDGGVWRYQYADTSTTHDLTEVIAPDGKLEEVNTYDSSNRLATQYSGTDFSNYYRLGYLNNSTSSTTNIITDMETGNETDYAIDLINGVVTRIQGALCDCGGDTNRNFTYDAFNRLTSVTDGDGSTHTVQLSYQRDAFVTNLDGTGQTLQQALPGPTQIIEPLNGNATKNSRTIGFAYGTGDKLDLVTKVNYPSVEVSGQNASVTLVYNSAGLPLTITRSGKGSVTRLGTTTTLSYNQYGQLTTWQGPPPTAAGRVATQGSISYFPVTDSDALRQGQPQTITKTVDGTHTLQWALGIAASYASYDIFGKPLSSTDPNSVSTEFAFDAAGRTTTRIDGVTATSSGEKTTLVYDASGNLTNVTRPLGNSTLFAYSPGERLTNVVRDDSSKQDHEQLVFSYTEAGRLKSETAQLCLVPAKPCGATNWSTTRSENFTYDYFGRLQSIVHPTINGQQATIQIGYDPAGNLTSLQDENHTSPNVTISYDYANRVTQQSEAHVSPSPGPSVNTLVEYDQLDNSTKVTDPNGNSTSYAYDDFGRLLQLTSPVGGQMAYSYDTDDTLIGAVDANQQAIGGQTAYSYDALGRILSEIATVGTNSESSTWVYDSGTGKNLAGRLVSETDPTGPNDRTIYSYNGRGLVTDLAQTIGGHTYTSKFYYDNNGNQTQTNFPSNRIVNFGYDFADRANAATLAGSPATSLITAVLYEPFGPMRQLSYGSGQVQTLTHDARYRPVEDKVVTGSGQTVADYLYSEDGVGNITTISDNLDCGYSRGLGYDDLNRLITANTGTLVNSSCSSKNSLWGGGSFSYDSAGNVTKLALGSRSATFTPLGTTSKLQSVAASSGPSGSVGYDSVGDETSVGSNTYAYSPRELLKTDVANSLNYGYDARGVRTLTTAPQGARYSIYAPNLQLEAESGLSSSVDAYDYVYVEGRPVAQLDSNGLHLDIADHLGTPFLQTDMAGTTQWRSEYEPYGNIYALRSGDVHQPLRFPGQVAQQFDFGANGSSDLDFNTHRWYRPGWSRYSQSDSKRIHGGLEPFGYGLDNPIGMTDRDGLWPGPDPPICVDNPQLPLCSGFWKGVYFGVFDVFSHPTTTVSLGAGPFGGSVSYHCGCLTGNLSGSIGGGRFLSASIASGFEFPAPSNDAPSGSECVGGFIGLGGSVCTGDNGALGIQLGLGTNQYGYSHNFPDRKIWCLADGLPESPTSPSGFELPVGP